MDLIILIPISGIIFIAIIYILEFPAFLVRMIQNYGSLGGIKQQFMLYAFSPFYHLIIGVTLLFFGAIMTIVVLSFMVILPVSIVILPLIIMIYLWYQLGDMMLEIAESMQG